MKKKGFILITIFLAMSFSACNKTDDTKLSEVGSAVFHFEDGKKVNFEATFNTNISVHPDNTDLCLSNSLDGTLIYIKLLTHKPLEAGEYQGYISVRQIGSNNIIDEKYNSHYFMDRDSIKNGYSKLFITDINENHVKGNFSGILFSESGKKMWVENGKFDLNLQNKYY